MQFDDAELRILDDEVTAGRAPNRVAAVHQGIACLARRQRYRRDADILAHLSERGEAVYPDLADIHEHNAFTDLD
ncbi:MAG: hypothetical protein LBS56_11165 [Propionibacteriaceae bacterium]|jgi:hypothetical protein|nr:hypothetical protein [Propionibacteriaceae bacterium]